MSERQKQERETDSKNKSTMSGMYSYKGINQFQKGY
jgi:hypothetical protein